MKFSFSTLGCPGWDLQRTLDEAKKDGYDGLEIRGISGEMRADKIDCFALGHQQTARRMADEASIKLIGFGSSCSFHDPSKRDMLMADARAAIDVAAALGMGFVRVFGDRIAEDDDENEIIARVVEGERELCDYAAGTGVLILQEVHGNFNLAERVLRVADGVGRDNFGLLWDVAHSDRSYGDAWRAFYEAIRPLIHHVHFKDHIRHKDSAATLCSTGKGDIPLGDIVKTLERDGYDGYISLEWEKAWHPDLDEPEVEFPHFIDYVKSLL